MKRSLVLLVLLVAVCIPLTVAHAAPVGQETTPVTPLSDLLTTFQSLTGVAMLIAGIVNALKQFGVVKDGQAGTWSSGLNLGALVVLFSAQILGYGSYIPSVNEQAGGLAAVFSVLFAYIYQLYAARKTHDVVLAGLPVIGKTFSSRAAGETVTTVAVS